jgi:hypothetical protein
MEPPTARHEITSLSEARLLFWPPAARHFAVAVLNVPGLHSGSVVNIRGLSATSLKGSAPVAAVANSGP